MLSDVQDLEGDASSSTSPQAQHQIVDDYLRGLERKPRSRARSRPAEEIKQEAAEVERELADASGSHRLELLQRREDLQREALRAHEEAKPDLPSLEARFITVALQYAERKGISYSTWREFGVDKAVLDEAGIKRTRRPYRSRDTTA